VEGIKYKGVLILLIGLFFAVSCIYDVSSERTVLWNIIYFANIRVLIIGFCWVAYKNSYKSGLVAAVVALGTYQVISLLVYIGTSLYLKELIAYLAFIQNPFLGIGFSVLAGLLLVFIQKGT